VCAVLADDVARNYTAGIIKGHNVKRATQHEREFRFRLMTMRAEIGLPVGDHEKALHRVVG